MSIRAVVRRHGLHWHLIQDLVDVWSALVAEHRRSCRCRVLLVDETSMRKRHRYVTVIVKRRHRPGPGHGRTSQRCCVVRVFHRTRAPLVPRRPSGRVRWVEVLQGSHRRPSRSHPPCVGPVPCREMVRRRAHPGAPAICNAANRPASNRHSTPTCSEPASSLLQRADHLNEHDQARLDQLFATHPRLRAG